MSEPDSAGWRPWAGSLLWPGWIRSRRVSGGQLATRLLFLLVGLGMAVVIHLVAVWFLGLCYRVEVVGPVLCQRLLDITLLVLLSVLVLSNVVTAISSFFLADDLELLVVAPIPDRSLFGARFAQQILQSSWMVLAFGLPVLLAFARVAGGGATYLAVAAVLPPLLIYPAALGAALVLLLLAVLPAARARGLVLALIFVGFIVLYLAVRLMEPERLVNPDGFASLVHLLSSLAPPSSSWLPSHWATGVVVATFRDVPARQEWPLLLFTLWTGAGALHVGASALFRALHRRGFSRSQEGKRVARLGRLWARLRGKAPPAESHLRSPGQLAPAVDWIRLLGCLAPRGAHREMVIKDAKLLLRDASQWSQLVLLLALVFVYLYNFRHFRQIGEAGLVGPLALYLVGMGLAGFVTTAVSVRFAFPLISLEGRMLWLLRSAPLRPRDLLAAKLLATLPPLLLVAEVLSILSSLILGVPLRLVLLGAGVAGLTALSVAALAVGVGALLPDYRAESAARVASSFGGLVCMSVALVVALLLVGLSIYPAWVLYADLPVRWPRLIGCGLGALLACGLAVGLSLWLGSRALQRHEP